MLVFLILSTDLSIYLVSAAVECDNRDIRMSNRTVTMNRDIYYMTGGLQVCVNNTWATVCQSGWGDDDATVACRPLGLVYAGSKLKLVVFPKI